MSNNSIRSKFMTARLLSHFRTMSTSAPPRNPLILILGATGTGKSNLAIQLAQHLSRESSLGHNNGFTGAEIINADAMQLYCGLPIITNKVTVDEQQGIPHHLLDHIGLEEEPWTVQRYVQEADKVVETIRMKGKLPIVVGGTSYYVYGLLFKNAILEETSQGDTASSVDDMSMYGKDAGKIWPILESSNHEIYAELQRVDPEQAKRWHPNDRRRIQRSLEIYLSTGRRASDIYKEQKEESSSKPDLDTQSANEAALDIDSTLRYDPVIFWLEAEDMTLKDRLNQRVDTMVKSGLLKEVQQMDEFMKSIQGQTVPTDKSKGIWVSIGYKEMEPWSSALGDVSISDKSLEQLKLSCIEAVKAGTRQYAKRQNRFIRLRLANALSGTNASHGLFLLDCTDLERWQDNVEYPAQAILDLFLRGETLPEPSGLSELARRIFASKSEGERSSERVARRCETCNKVLMNEKEWLNHIGSRSHSKILQGIRKRELNEERMRCIQSASNEGPC